MWHFFCVSNVYMLTSVQNVDTNGLFPLIMTGYIVLNGFFTSTNSVDPDEMQGNAALHLVLHRMQKYSFRGFLNTKS